MKLFETLEQQLKKEPNFVTDDGDLKKWVVLNKAQNFDEEQKSNKIHKDTYWITAVPFYNDNNENEFKTTLENSLIE